MHPLLLLLPALLCAGVALGLAITMAQEIRAGLIRLRSVEAATGAVIVVGAATGAVVSFAAVLL